MRLSPVGLFALASVVLVGLAIVANAMPG
jgi:hypothetical protein